MAGFGERMIRAAKLEARIYEEVEADKGATGQAMAVVILSSLAAGLGSLREGVFTGAIFITLAALLGWFIWALMTYWIGTKLLPEPQTNADLGQMLRTTGFSSSPGVIRILGAVPMPGLALLSALIASIWMLIAMVVAVRHALDYSNIGRALGVCVIGWIIQLIIFFALGPSPFTGSAY
jgi:hypothetical protein